MRKLVSGAVVMGLALGCATAPPPPPTPAAPAQSAQGVKGAEGAQGEQASAEGVKKDPDRTLVCEHVTVTGSHIPRKVCRTVRQMEQEREQAQKVLRDAERVNREWGK